MLSTLTIARHVVSFIQPFFILVNWKAIPNTKSRWSLNSRNICILELRLFFFPVVKKNIMHQIYQFSVKAVLTWKNTAARCSSTHEIVHLQPTTKDLNCWSSNFLETQSFFGLFLFVEILKTIAGQFLQGAGGGTSCN